MFHNPSLKHNPNASNGQIYLQRSKHFYSKIFSSSILKLEIQVVMLNTWKIESSSKRYANYPASAQSTHQSLDYDFIDSFLLLWCVFAEGNRSNVAPRFFTIQSNLLTPLQPLLENETTRVQFHEIKESPTNSSSVGKHRVLQRTYRIRI